MTYPNDPQQPGQSPYGGQPPYGQPPQYGAPTPRPYAAPGSGPGFAPGLAPTPPPQGNKKGWIIVGVAAALLAIAAVVVVIIVVKKNGKVTTASPGGANQAGPAPGAGGGDSGAQKTDPSCDYGVKIDPNTGDTIECTGGQQSQQQTTEETANFAGTWTVTGILTSSSGVWSDASGAPLAPGSTVFEATWIVTLGPCTADQCAAYAATQSGSPVSQINFEWDGAAWQASFTFVSSCGVGSTTDTQIVTDYSLAEVTPDKFAGTGQLTTAGTCGAVDTLFEDVTLVRQ